MEKLLIRNICQPRNSNPYGTGHGGWVITQMAQGGIYMTQLISKGNAVLVESNIKYKNPMHVGKFLNVYGSIKSVKQSKMVLNIIAKRSEMDQKEIIKYFEDILIFDFDRDKVKFIIFVKKIETG